MPVLSLAFLLTHNSGVSHAAARRLTGVGGTLPMKSKLPIGDTEGHRTRVYAQKLTLTFLWANSTALRRHNGLL